MFIKMKEMGAVYEIILKNKISMSLKETTKSKFKSNSTTREGSLI